MEGKNPFNNLSAARVVASIFGILSGLGSITHGVGETLQGNVTPEGIVVNSWTQGPIATKMGGEPAMTIVPNLLVAGLLTIIVSLVAIVWSAIFVQRKNGGLILILLSIAMLLVGGGFAPPIIGVLAGVAGLGINAPYAWWRTHFPVNIRRFLAQLWPWLLGACVINGVFLVVGSVILVYFFGINNPDLFVNSFFFAILSLLLTIITGVAYDLQAGERGGGIQD
jgi:hypothetical protein